MALRPGDAVHAGRVFRRIPPLRSRFDRGQVKLGVFKPADAGRLSTTWEPRAPVAYVLAVAVGIVSAQGTFGLCAVSIETVHAASEGRVRFLYDPDPDDWLLGDAHVVVPDCDDPEIQSLLLRHAYVIQPPMGPEIR